MHQMKEQEDKFSINLKTDTGRNTIITEGFNTPAFMNGQTTRKKTEKETATFKEKPGQMTLMNIYRVLH